jgi:putative redox protein
MTHKIECKWLEDMTFEAEADNHVFQMDLEEEKGGHDKGPRPKTLTLVSLAGCTGMDVVFILRKMKIIPTYFNIQVEGELTETNPKYYHKIHLIYEIQVENVPHNKVEEAVKLSQDTYCGVSALLKKGAELTYEIKYL